MAVTGPAHAPADILQGYQFPQETLMADAALVIAHPGHELRVFGWASQVRPLTFVLTRGDGRSGESRLHSTSAVLASIGARQGSVYGRFSDREIYELLLGQRHDVLLGLRDELAEAFVAANITVVACDAEEWYNPSHDVCRYVAVAAAKRAETWTGRPIQVFDFPLVAAPDTCPEHLRSRAIRLELDDATFSRKLQSAQHYLELRSEVERALAADGAEAFRVECLRPALPSEDALVGRPFYEDYGERQVKAGHYAEAITFDGHVSAMRTALNSW
jgi:hypothetical protein